MFVDNVEFAAGYVARNRKLPVNANPYLNDGGPYRLWDLGWNLADVQNNEAIYNDNHFMRRVDKEPFDQGVIAYKTGLDKVECPYGDGDANGTDDEKATHKARWEWLFGYAHAESLANVKAMAKQKREVDKSVSEITVRLNVETMINGKSTADFIRQFENLFGKSDRDPNAV